ncbi:MAG: hypothetical protein M3Z00_00420 [Actinomycetota bacterium]|nr:hypothetical protein [Actinomycetota bacterium]
MSDVHCPARLFVIRQPEPGQPGHSPDTAQVAALAVLLRPERIAAVHHAHDRRQQACRLAELLGVTAVATDGLDAAAEPLPDTAVAALEGIADAYRGEAVVVVASRALIERVLPRLATDVSDGLTACFGDIVELAADADGWRLFG